MECGDFLRLFFIIFKDANPSGRLINIENIFELGFDFAQIYKKFANFDSAVGITLITARSKFFRLNVSTDTIIIIGDSYSFTIIDEIQIQSRKMSPNPMAYTRTVPSPHMAC